LLNQDFKDLLSTFNEHGVEFLVVGAHALAAHGFIRATKDFDVWVRPNALNALRVMSALQAFGAPTHKVSEKDFAVPGITFQIGIDPVRIDVITVIDGIEFDSAWRNRVSAEYGGVPAFVLSKADLIANKQASGRPQDLADIDKLLNHE
jgi:hypothetical protein